MAMAVIITSAKIRCQPEEASTISGSTLFDISSLFLQSIIVRPERMLYERAISLLLIATIHILLTEEIPGV